MKKLFNQLTKLTALGALVILASCGSDDSEPVLPEAPTINSVTTTPASSGGVTTLTVGQSLEITVSASFPGGFNNLSLSDGLGTTITKDRNTEGIAAGTVDVTLTFGGGNDVISFDQVGVATLTITAVDDNNLTAAETINLEIIGNPATVYTAKLLYAPLGSEDSKTFFSTNLGTTHTKNEVDAAAAPNSSDIDFGYAASASDVFYLSSPSAYPSFVGYDLSIWNTLNTTIFKSVTLTNEEYLAVDTDVELEELYTSSSDTGSASKSGFAEGDTFAFQLDVNKGSKYGLVKIMAIVDGNGNGDYFDSVDYMEIEVIIE